MNERGMIDLYLQQKVAVSVISSLVVKPSRRLPIGSPGLMGNLEHSQLSSISGPKNRCKINRELGSSRKALQDRGVLTCAFSLRSVPQEIAVRSVSGITAAGVLQLVPGVAWLTTIAFAGIASQAGLPDTNVAFTV